MKYVGLDYGQKRIGVAVSDESATLAFPVGAVAAGEGALQEVLDIMRENGANIAVVGESRDLSGKPNDIMQEIEAFARALQARGVAVDFEPEFFTSAQAERQGRDKRGAKLDEAAHRDASAAALILQSYLDRMRKNG